MEVQGERKDEDRGPSYEGGYLYSDICRTWDRIDYIAAFHVFAKKTEVRQSQRCGIRQVYIHRP